MMCASCFNLSRAWLWLSLCTRPSSNLRLDQGNPYNVLITLYCKEHTNLVTAGRGGRHDRKRQVERVLVASDPWTYEFLAQPWLYTRIAAVHEVWEESQREPRGVSVTGQKANWKKEKTGVSTETEEISLENTRHMNCLWRSTFRDERPWAAQGGSGFACLTSLLWYLVQVT